MLSAEGSIQVGATPRDVLELVCDMRAYMALDGKRPFGLLIERYGRDWLQQDLEDELRRIKEHFGSGFERR